MIKSYQKNEQGQTLLFIIVAMTIALSIAINVSVRTITSLSRTTRTDTASRALAAAEGGIERFLYLPAEKLNDAISGTCPDGTQSATCDVVFDTTEAITSKATVSVARYEPDAYHMNLSSGEVKEVNLYDEPSSTGYSQSTLTVCWTPVNSAHTDLIYTSYSDTGILYSGGLTPQASIIADPEHIENNYIEAGPGNGSYTNCVNNLDIGNNAYGFRIYAYYGDADIGIYPTNSATLPMQGYEITSVGTLVQDTGVTSTKTIKIIRSLPYLSGAFENALYITNDLSK